MSFLPALVCKPCIRLPEHTCTGHLPSCRMLHAGHNIIEHQTVVSQRFKSTNVAYATSSKVEILNIPAWLPWCRKWPTAHSLQPQQLDCVTSATVDQLVTNDCKVLWAPAATGSSAESSSGKWVSASEACLVNPSDEMASAVIIEVGRRAGLHIPQDLPDHVFKASRQAPTHKTAKCCSPDTALIKLVSFCKN